MGEMKKTMGEMNVKQEGEVAGSVAQVSRNPKL